jgi:hypothetical protein
MSGTIKIGGVELTISDNNSSDIALASFSGYMGFTGEIISQYGGIPGKIVGLVFDVSGGVITGVFDSKINSQKQYDNIIGTLDNRNKLFGNNFLYVSQIYQIKGAA